MTIHAASRRSSSETAYRRDITIALLRFCSRTEISFVVEEHGVGLVHRYTISIGIQTTAAGDGCYQNYLRRTISETASVMTTST